MQEIITTKFCPTCKINKEIIYFTKDNSRKDKLRSQCKSCIMDYRKINKNKVSEYQYNYQMKNKDRLLNYHYEYRRTLKGKINSINSKQKRRALTKLGDVTSNQILLLIKNINVCYWCNESLKNKKVHIDHYEPLAKGGEHTLSNLVVSCNKCNLKKNAKDPIDFANSLGRLL